MKLLLEEEYTDNNTYYNYIYTPFDFTAKYESVIMVELLLERFDIRANMLCFKEHVVLLYVTISNHWVES